MDQPYVVAINIKVMSGGIFTFTFTFTFILKSMRHVLKDLCLHVIRSLYFTLMGLCFG